MNVIKLIKRTGIRKEAAAVGVIEQSDELEKLWADKKELCRKNAVPRGNKVSGIELKNYLIEQHGAVELEFPERQKQRYKAGLLYDLHPEIFPESFFPPQECGEKTLIKWAEKHDFEEINIFARDISEEKHNLRFSYLEIPEKEVRIYLEITTGHMQLSSTWYDIEDLSREIVLWSGITQEDIDNETDAFMIYATEYYHNFQKGQL
jgi:hypothetical protein